MKPNTQSKWQETLDNLALAIQKEMVETWKSTPEREEDEEVRNALLRCRSCKVDLYQGVIRTINKLFGAKYIDMAGSLTSHFEKPYKEE